MNYQLSHTECKEKQKNNKNNIIFVLENLEHMENIGGAFRLADAFNIEEIIIINSENSKLDFNKISKTARDTETHIKFTVVNKSNDVLSLVSKKGYTLFALEITNESKSLREINFAQFKGIALVLGNERNGVSEELLNSSFCTHIEMYGINSSMNAVAALGIATYKISEDYLQSKISF